MKKVLVVEDNPRISDALSSAGFPLGDVEHKNFHCDLTRSRVQKESKYSPHQGSAEKIRRLIKERETK